jgi:exodeoxyribonuclease VII large subunit
MSEDGVGDLYLAYEQLKKRLNEEGLFDPKHKKPIPRFPKTIAVLTSPTGAAVRDVINIVNRRFPISKIIVYPTLVQGEYAKDSIITQIKKVNNDKLADVMILGRGGGSIEDLWPFNEEQVAYEIFKSEVPIISSVGHETDFTISDFVADLRAPTPSGGAEIAVPDQSELLSYITRLNEQNKVSLNRLLKQKTDKLDSIRNSVILRDPLRLLESKSRRLDHLMDKLSLLHPGNQITLSKKELEKNERRLSDYFKRILDIKKNRYILDLNKLELVNPLSIMKKGYSVSRVNGTVIKSIKDVTENDNVTIQVNDGIINTTVQNVEKGRS